MADAATALLPPVPRPCGVAEIIATVNRANALYARAVRTLDAGILSPVWAVEALADMRSQVLVLRYHERYATPSLLAISVEELTIGDGRATVRTVEHWLYQERERETGALVLDLDLWAENSYTLAARGSAWSIVRDVTRLIPAPAPRPVPASVRLSTDRRVYQSGEQVTATLVNSGSLPVVLQQSGHMCRPIRLEWLGSDGRQPAPVPVPLIACPELVHIQHPGESSTWTPLFGPPGTYRLAAGFSIVGAEFSRTAYSATYRVR